jgi:hypothetical protein
VNGGDGRSIGTLGDRADGVVVVRERLRPLATARGCIALFHRRSQHLG